MKVFVACSSMTKIEDKYFNYAKELCNLLNKYDDEVYVGGKIGIMGYISDTLRSWGKDTNIIITELYKNELTKEDKLYTVVNNTEDRLHMLLSECDTLVVFPGGLGTLSELFEVMESKRSDKRNIDIIILNIDNYYDDVIAVLKKYEKNGFLNKKLEDLSYIVSSIQEFDLVYSKIKEENNVKKI